MNTKKYIVLFVLILLFSFVGCKKKKEQKEILNANCASVVATYSLTIKPLVTNNCLGCHWAGSANGDFTTYNGLKTVVNNGTLFSEVVKNGTMPPSSSLSKDDRIKFKCWIDNGAINN